MEKLFNISIDFHYRWNLQKKFYFEIYIIKYREISKSIVMVKSKFSLEYIYDSHFK